MPGSANTLFSLCEQNSMFLSRAWLENLTLHTLAEDQTILLASVIENEDVLAILPMVESPRDGLSSLSNHFTTLFSILISNHGPRDAIFTCLAEGLAQMPAQPIRFEPIDLADNHMIKLRHMMEVSGFQGVPYFRFYNWSHPLNGQSFDEYMARRPARLRNTIMRKQRQLEREHDLEIRLYKDVDVEKALEEYRVIYQASWKANEFFSEFTPNLVRKMANSSWLRLAILSIDQQPVAAQIWFVVHKKANIYRLVYDERWKKFSPGSILTQYLMRYVIDTDKVSEIDFLTGNERYKQDWMTVQKERVGIRFINTQKQKYGVRQALLSLKNFVYGRISSTIHTS